MIQISMLHFIILLPLFISHKVLANTEIINFLALEENNVDFSATTVASWPTLSYKHNQRFASVDPALLSTPLQQVCEPETEDAPFSCAHELWVALDLNDDNWIAYPKFTLRLSWPASSPADFLLEIYSPQAISTRLSKHQHHPAIADPASITPPHSSRAGAITTRLQFARIRVVDAGVLTPTLDRAAAAAAAAAASTIQAVDPIPFILVLEPLYWGILPASLLPTVSFLIPVLSGAGLAALWILGYLDHLVQQARQELFDSRTAQEGKEH